MQRTVVSLETPAAVFVPFRILPSGLFQLMIGVADISPHDSAQGVRIGVFEGFLIAADRLRQLSGIPLGVSLAGIQLGISGENLERPVDIQINRIEPLAVSFDVDHRTVIVQLGRLVSQMQLVEGQRLLQLSGIDQMLRIQFDDILIVGIADRKRRDQVVELKEVVPVKTDVERQLPENADLFRQGEFVNFEKPFRHGQISMRIVALVVEFGERSQRRDIHGVDLQRPVILGYGQRILFGSTVQVGQNHVVFRFVRNRLGHLPGFGQRTVQLPRANQQLAFHRPQQRHFTETHLGRIEHIDRRIGHPGLLVQDRQNTNVVGIGRVERRKPHEQRTRLVEFSLSKQFLPVKLPVPLVERVQPVSTPCPRRTLRIAVGSHRREAEPGRSIRGIELQGLQEQCPGRQGVLSDQEFFTPSV